MARSGMSRLERLAGEIAIAASSRERPLRLASVPWVIVQDIRRELERIGFDWRAAKRQMQRTIEERRQRDAH